MSNEIKNRRKITPHNSTRNNNAYYPPKNRSNIKHKSRVKRNVKIINIIRTACLLFVILLLLFVASETFQVATISSTTDSIKSFFSSLSSGDGYPYKISSSSVKNINMLSSNVYLLTDTSTITLDKTAKEISKINHTYTNPAVSIKNGRAIVYDRGRYRYMVQNRTEQIYSGKVKNEILTCEIGRSGNIAIATLGKNSNNYVTVYESKGKKEVFKWVCYAEKIVDISLSNNGKYMAVAVVSAKDANVMSKVYLFDFNYDSAVTTIEYPNTALYELAYVSRNDVVAIGDNLKSYIRNNSKDKTDIDFGTSTLTRYSLAENGINSLVLSEYGSSNSNLLKVYDKSGEELYTKKFNKKINWVYCDGRYINVLVDNILEVYDLGGDKENTIQMKSDSMKVLACGRTKYIYGIGEVRQNS